MSERTEQTNVRLSRAERAKFERAAKRAGLSFSEWLRMVGLAAAGNCPLCGAKKEAAE